jgi:hypothetical protein
MMTGTGDARIAWIISRVEDSRPPGVSRRTTTAWAPSVAARPSAFANCSAATKPIAPLMSSTRTARSGGGWAIPLSVAAAARRKAPRSDIIHAVIHAVRRTAVGRIGGTGRQTPNLPLWGASRVIAQLIEPFAS